MNEVRRYDDPEYQKQVSLQMLATPTHLIACRAITDLREENRALAARVQAVERKNAAIKATVGDTEYSLRQQLAEAQGTIVRKDEALEINRQAHGIVRDQLTQADQQVTRLREAALQAVVDEPEMSGEMPDGMYQAVHALDREGLAEWCRIMVRATKRGITERLQHALRETGAGKEDVTVTAHRVGCATAEQIEQYIRMADAELGPECVDAWVEDIRQFLRARYNTR